MLRSLAGALSAYVAIRTNDEARTRPVAWPVRRPRSRLVTALFLIVLLADATLLLLSITIGILFGLARLFQQTQAK